ncbi:hypothetical protein ENSA7_39910 [Enhygromyxa salina]|uniref:Right handed beta helix domain-containing protein n=1 Tax=Enhygromyxa salina TaxID=215803 RepID=A0A2S9YMK2_9BACT|nr:hypothetical protein ENSA7_39910 [Enhygromyxa salina]
MIVGDDTADTGTSDTTDTTGTDTDTDTTDTTDTAEDWVSTHGPEHCGEITGDEVWAADLNPHIITCDVFVEGGSVQVGPGVEIRAYDKTGIFVSRDGGTADFGVFGSEAAPVELRSDSGTGAGLWKGISVFPAAGTIELHHATIDSGGGFNTEANLYVEGGEALVDHVTLTNAEEWGLALREGARLSPDSTALQIHATMGWPVLVDPGHVHSLPATDSDYTGNDSDGIYIHATGLDWYDVHESVTWEHLGVDYFVFTPLSLEGTANAAAVLELGPGVTVRFADDAPLRLAYHEGAAGLITLGEPTAPVVLSSMNSLDRGAWPGVRAFDNTVDASFRLTHTIIEWGGGFNADGCLYASDAGVFVDHVELRGCESAGFLFEDNARFLPDSTDLQVHDSDRSGEIRANQVHTIPKTGVDLTGNDADVIAIWGFNHEIDHAVTWANLGVPYRAETHIYLEGTALDPGVLTLEPGVTFAFAADNFLRLSQHGGASGLLAIGTAEQPIVFTGADALDPGAWAGIRIQDDAIDGQTRFEHVEIRSGGGFNSDANVTLYDASPTFINTRIVDSDCWGIWADSFSNPSLSGVVFENNSCGDVGP